MWRRRASTSDTVSKAGSPSDDGGPKHDDITRQAMSPASLNRYLCQRGLSGTQNRKMALLKGLMPMVASTFLVFILLYCRRANPATLSPAQGQQQKASPSIFRTLQSLSMYPNLFFWNMKQAAEEVALQGALTFNVAPARVDSLFDNLDPLSDAMGVTADVEIFDDAWEGFWLRNGKTCLAHDTRRLMEAVNSTACDVVVLVAGHVYNLDRMMHVYKPTTVIGNPADRPVINAAEAERAFLVHSGATFDVRHILFYEGDGDLIRNEIRTRFGGAIYMSIGTRLFAFDCLFTIQPVRESFINSAPEFIFGGDILMEGGVMTLVGCSFFAVVPGFINSVSTELGGAVLILSGAATLTLVNFMTTQIFAYNAGGGMHLTVLGGSLAMTACTHTANLVFAGQGLVGRNIFLGGGVGVFTSIAVTDTMAFLSFWGAGFSIMIGSGLGIFTGSAITLNAAFAQLAGVGVAFGVGAGMALFYGTAFAKNLGIAVWHSTGVFIFCGAGRIALVGCVFGHQNAIASWQLLGGAVYLGTGQAVYVGCAWARSLGLDFFAGLGGDLYLGAGQIVLVEGVFTSNTGITVFLGQGTELFVAAGSAFVKNVNFSANAGIHYLREGTFSFVVGGRKCEVTTEESTGSFNYREKGYGLCFKGFDGSERSDPEGSVALGIDDGNVVPTLVVEKLHAHQQLGGWHGLTPLYTPPQVMYVGSNITSCALCGLENVEVRGPGMEGCPAGTEEACPAESPVSSGRTSALMEPATAAADVASGSAATPFKKARKFFGLGSRLRKLITGEKEDDPIRSTGTDEIKSSHHYDPDALLPDSYVVIADLMLECQTDGVEAGCGILLETLQEIVESSWLKGLEDEARVHVAKFKSSDSLREMLGIPSMDGVAAPSSTDTNIPQSKRSSSGNLSEPSCNGHEAFVAYAHTSDKSTYESLKASLSSATESATIGSGSGSTLSADLALLLSSQQPTICTVNFTLQDSFMVPAPLAKFSSTSTGSSSSATASNRAKTAFQGLTLPRVWINITSPVITPRKTYDIVISEFDDKDIVGLQLMAKPSKDKKKSLFFSSTPRLLHTFQPFDSDKHNQTWAWRVSPLVFQGMASGPYFLKAFDVLEPKRFVLSQAFQVERSAAEPRQGAGKGAASSLFPMKAERILHRLDPQNSPTDAHLREDPEPKTDRETPVLESDSRQNHRPRQLLDEDSSDRDLLSMMATLLALPEDTSLMDELWKALLAFPASQTALADEGLARKLLERAPVLQTAPSVVALDADDGAGWRDPGQVQAALGKAIADFVDLSVSVLRQQRGRGDGPKGMGKADVFDGREDPNDHWPARILGGLTPEEEALAARVGRDGDLEAMGELMDTQAAHRFGGMTMARLKAMELGDEFKGGLASEIFRDLIDDPEIWQELEA